MTFRAEILIQMTTAPSYGAGMHVPDPVTVISVVRTANTLVEVVEMIREHLDLVKEM